MKCRMYLFILLIISFISCQSNNRSSNILLSNFTKELISLYLNDSLNSNANIEKDDVIITSITDSSHIFISIFTNNSKLYDYCRDDFIGQTTYLGHLIRIFGEDNNIFFTVTKRSPNKQQCNDNFMEIDPDIWQVCLYKDKSFCKLRTYRFTVKDDISAIQSLAEKYFFKSDSYDNSDELFKNHEVEISPRFLLGEDSLFSLVSSNFKVKRKVNKKVPVVVDLIVDKEGKATLKGISMSSVDNDINNEALRVADIICQYEFIPALHRGEKVNAIFPVIFFNDHITP
jgi:hypothetical protein